MASQDLLACAILIADVILVGYNGWDFIHEEISGRIQSESSKRVVEARIFMRNLRLTEREIGAIVDGGCEPSSG